VKTLPWLVPWRGLPVPRWARTAAIRLPKAPLVPSRQLTSVHASSSTSSSNSFAVYSGAGRGFGGWPTPPYGGAPASSAAPTSSGLRTPKVPSTAHTYETPRFCRPFRNSGLSP
jgi:hypothetical protein